MTIPTIHIKNATLAYNDNVVFSNLNMELPARKWVALLGPSGIGKSSLLRMIAGLMSEQEKSLGTIYADNDVPIRQQIVYMAQTDLLLPWLTVLRNATLGMTLRHDVHHSDATIQKATLLLKKVGLGDVIHCYPEQCSGGMRQRVALVRTLMEKKPVVLMDEPFSALDAITRYKLQELAADLLKDKTVLFITHDPAEALRLADDIYIMQGQPASIKPVARLTSITPRQLTHPETIELQRLLYHELSQATGTLS